MQWDEDRLLKLLEQQQISCLRAKRNEPCDPLRQAVDHPQLLKELTATDLRGIATARRSGVE
jgi:hypothetical protein